MPVGRSGRVTGLGTSLAAAWALLARRWHAGVLVLVGVGLAVPTVWLPTFRLSLSDAGRGALLSEENAWSWGRSVLRGGPERVFGNEQGLVLLLVALALGLIGALVWLLVPGVVGLLLALVAVAIVTSRVVTSVAQRLGRAAEVEVYTPTGLDVRSYTLPGAVLETASAVVLVVALAVMVVQALRWVRVPAAGGEGGADEREVAEVGEPGSRPAEAARVGVARLAPERDLTPGDRRLGGEPVSFTDRPRDDGSDRSR
ncbi:MAG: hypothetical protein ABIS35_10595 [Terracoccus sp.]